MKILSCIAFTLGCCWQLLAAAQTAPDAESVPRSRATADANGLGFSSASPESVGLNCGVLDGIADAVASWIVAGDLVGAELLIIKDGQSVLHESFGWSELDPPRLMTCDQIISIKSMTKPITATAVLVLVQDGKLSLDDPVSKHIPEFVGNDEITIHHLLSQTSGDSGGHGGGGYNVYDFDSLEDWVVDWAGSPRQGPPVGNFAYSNFNYAALGLIIQRVSGAPCEEFIHERILNPLGMSESFFAFAPDVAWASRVPGRFRQKPGGGFERYWSNAEQQKWKFFPAGFGIWCTTADFARFMRAWIDTSDTRPTVLSRETIRNALLPHGKAGGDPVYGYGWFIEFDGDSSEPVLFRHGGNDGSVGMALPQSNAMVLFMTHTEAGWHRQSLLGQLTMSGLFDHPGPNMVWAKTHPVEEVILSEGQQRSVLGSYRSDEGTEGPKFVATVSTADARLRLRLQPVNQSPAWWLDLVPVGEGVFRYGRYADGALAGIDPRAEVRFEHQDDGSCHLLVYDRGLLVDKMIRVRD